MRELTAVVAFAAWSALAQTAAVDSADLSRGTTLLPSSTAFSDEATSLVYNPAGLTRTGRFNAWYVHERSNTRGLNADSVFAAAAVADLFGIGLASEWLRPVDGPNRQLTRLGLAFGGDKFSAGFSATWLSGGVPRTIAGLDLGLQARPLRWLALGAGVRNVNSPGPLNREWTAGLGLRPFGERLSVGVDWLFSEATPLAQSRLQYTVQATLVRGLRVLGGFSHGFAPGQPAYAQAGLGVDLEHVGYTQGLSYADGVLDWQFAARVSADAHGSLLTSSKVAVVNLADLNSPAGGTLGSLLGLDTEDRYLRLLRFLDRAAQDPELAGLVIKVEGTGLGLARADELRSAIVRLRTAGKKVYAYILSAADAEYLMVSHCDGIYAAPEAMLIIDGLRTSVMYFGGTAKQLGVQVDVARVGKYKNFPDQFTRFDMSDEQRESLNAHLDTAEKTLAARIFASRKLDAAAWKRITDEGLKSARREKQLGTIDDVLTPQQFEELLREKLPNARVSRDYQPLEQRQTRWGAQRYVAVIPVLGGIGGGKNQVSPILGPQAGAESFIESINAAAQDPDVVAIVVRVDSGGGDGLASDLMYRAVLEAKKLKPVVASMGDVAASGGYYVAMGADQVFASPTTLTGSIGVFFAKPGVRELAEKLGATQVSVQRGKLAGITDSFDPWSEEQRAAAQAWVDDFYDTFITEAAASRKLSKEALDAVARGRVWSGEDALAKQLVDSLGGLNEAIEAAKARAGVSEDVGVRLAKTNDGPLGSLVGAAVPSALLQLQVAAPQPTLPALLQSVIAQLGPAAWLFEAPKVQARLEWLVEIK
jgi:protease-4